MEPAFWHARWQEGRIGFHEGAPNGFLVRFADRLTGARRVLVPLCGKAEDLAFLAGRGHEVVGVELVEDAVQQFFAEHAIEPTVEAHGALRAYRAGALTVLAGDFFATTAAGVGAVDAIYDRAALVALPPDVRTRYVAHLRAIAPAARDELLVTIEYPAGAAEGPPFSVERAEVHAHFAGAQIEELAWGQDPRGRADGQMLERCYHLRFG